MDILREVDGINFHILYSGRVSGPLEVHSSTAVFTITIGVASGYDHRVKHHFDGMDLKHEFLKC